MEVTYQTEQNKGIKLLSKLVERKIAEAMQTCFDILKMVLCSFEDYWSDDWLNPKLRRVCVPKVYFSFPMRKK